MNRIGLTLWAFFLTGIARAGTGLGDVAGSVDHAAIGILHALKQIMLVLGLILLVRSVHLFRRYAKDSVSASVFGASWWGILGIAFVLIYFFVH